MLAKPVNRRSEENECDKEFIKEKEGVFLNEFLSVNGCRFYLLSDRSIKSDNEVLSLDGFN